MYFYSSELILMIFLYLYEMDVPTVWRLFVNLNVPRVSSSVSVSGQSADGNSSAARMVPFSCLRPCVSCLLYMTRCVDFEIGTSDFGVHICLTVGKGVGFFGSFAN